MLQPCVGCCLYYSLVLAAVCVTALCWLLCVLQPCVGCCLCYSLVLAAVCYSIVLAAVCVTALYWLLSMLQPCLAAVCVTALCWVICYILVSLTVCITDLCWLLCYSLVLVTVCITALCWLLSVLQTCVGCSVTALCWLLYVLQRKSWSSNSLLTLRYAERLTLWSDEWRFIGFLSKLAFRGCLCVQKIDAVLSWLRLHLYIHVICRRWFYSFTLKRNCYFFRRNGLRLPSHQQQQPRVAAYVIHSLNF